MNLYDSKVLSFRLASLLVSIALVLSCHNCDIFSACQGILERASGRQRLACGVGISQSTQPTTSVLLMHVCLVHVQDSRLALRRSMGQQASRRSLPAAEEHEEAPYELRSIRCPVSIQLGVVRFFVYHVITHKC